MTTYVWGRPFLNMTELESVSFFFDETDVKGVGNQKLIHTSGFASTLNTKGSLIQKLLLTRCVLTTAWYSITRRTMPRPFSISR